GGWVGSKTTKMGGLRGIGYQTISLYKLSVNAVF
ncbi:unnamed protein product, partial [marine sediment metagenome]